MFLLVEVFIENPIDGFLAWQRHEQTRFRDILPVVDEKVLEEVGDSYSDRWAVVEVLFL